MVRIIVFVLFVYVPGWAIAQGLPVSPDCRVNRDNQDCESMAKKYTGILGGTCFNAKCRKISLIWTCNLGTGFEISHEPELGYRDTREANSGESGSTIHNTFTNTTKCGTRYSCWCNPALMIDPNENPCSNQGGGDDYFPVESWIGALNCTGDLLGP